MPEIKFLLHINAPLEKVYQALTTIEGLSSWWTTQTSGNSKPGGIIAFRFAPPYLIDVKVTGLEENKSVTWECVAGADDWIGTVIHFQLDTNEGKTRLRFEHTGWKVTGDFYAACSFSWSRYLESLRQLCQTGNGEAYGSPNYRGGF